MMIKLRRSNLDLLLHTLKTPLNFKTKPHQYDVWHKLAKLAISFKDLIFRHLDPPRMLALDHTQLAGLNPHTASFIRLDFI